MKSVTYTTNPGDRFNRLVVIEKADLPRLKGRWHCLCDCGARSIVHYWQLHTGGTKSCGCLTRERMTRESQQRAAAELLLPPAGDARRRSFSAERLRALLVLDDSTGIFRWRVDRSIKTRAGDVAGTRGRNGRHLIKVDSFVYTRANLVWLYVTGAWPKHEIDHINSVRDDDRFSNLRDVDRTTNQQNMRSAFRNNKSTGLLGVSTEGRPGKFFARIRANGKSFRLGCYSTAEEAHQVYVDAKRRLHKGCTL